MRPFVAWRLLEDVLGWVAVLIVTITLIFTDCYILDPILSILIAVYILYNAIANLRKTTTLFLKAVTENIDIQKLEKVDSTHHTHVWSLDGEHHVLTSQVFVTDNTSIEEIQSIKNAIKHLNQNLKLEHITVEIEYLNEHCIMHH
ncbi:cation transporter [Hyella patelloides]|uniref:cation transporter n=1 Tax=Hyella patelloides TaxID=1982969 RepID=UPI0011A04304